ncbi:uncharacterized protein RJT20DRAFT_146923 [Scheffersomyces xylosifermentans]|uniref:uncharacterized protein n=1 Tax=Scheffersomyces xylosifermentans TaxID=1304137 RepID=UPI00315C8BC3
MSSLPYKWSSGSEFAAKWRQNRACARCRRLKMKCSYEDPSFKSCKRCFTAGVDCSFDEDPTAKYARKKRRKVPRAQSEEKDNTIADLITQAQNRQQLQSLFTKYKTLASRISEMLEINPTDEKKGLVIGEYPHISFKRNLIKEMILNYEFFTIEEARHRFRFFLEDMLPYYPTVALSENLKSFDNLFENNPLLLTACISVTAVNDNNLSQDPDKVSNSQLYKILNHYLYNFISHHVHVKCDDFSIDLIYVFLILSSWCLTPNKLGHFRNQLNSLTAFNISLCIDLGESSKFKDTSDASLGDLTSQRNDLRALLSVYCCCGSLELSLRRFKLVAWSKNHEIATQLLMRPIGTNLPTPEDRYLCYFAKFISTAQEILEFVSPIGMSTNTTTTSKTGTKESSFEKHSDHRTYISPSQVKYVLNAYERKSHQILAESGFMGVDNDKNHPKEKYVLSIMYYHLLTITYDNLISGFLHASDNENEKDILFQNSEVELCLQNIIKLLSICENLINCFVELNSEQTVNYPTVLYFRPMHALILLVRLRLVLKSKNFSNVESINDIIHDMEVEKYFEKVSKIIVDNQKVYNSVVCDKMMIILNKIEKWMKVSSAYNNATRVSTNGTSGDINLDLVKLISMSKDQEIESLDVPKDYEDNSKRRSEANMDMSRNAMTSKNQTPELAAGSKSAGEPLGGSIEKIFEEIDADVMNYLNPLESYFNTMNDINLIDFGNTMDIFSGTQTS